LTARTGLWTQWVVCSTLTILPVFLAVGMILLNRGFVKSIWLASLAVAVIAFLRAQQLLIRMQGLWDDDKINAWLRLSRSRGSSSSTDTGRHRVAGDDEGHEPEPWDKRALKMRSVKFWSKLPEQDLRPNVGKLFGFLGRAVRRVAGQRKMGEGLLVDFSTYVHFLPGESKIGIDELKELLRFLSSNSAFQDAILVAPQGFKKRSREFARDKLLILLDSHNLARLARREAVK
jgi:hypothetical protein